VEFGRSCGIKIEFRVVPAAHFGERRREPEAVSVLAAGVFHRKLVELASRLLLQ
jgi:hypothetical protein